MGLLSGLLGGLGNSGLGSFLTAPVAGVTSGVLSIIEMITSFVRNFGSIGR